MIWKRIGIMAGTIGLTVLAVWFCIFLLFLLHGSPAMKSLETFCGSPAKAEAAVWFVIFGGGLLCLTFLCGYMQPVTDTPWLSGFVWCPFTWFGLLDFRTMEKRPLLAITIVGMTWLACGLGMKLKARKACAENESTEQSSGLAPRAGERKDLL